MFLALVIDIDNSIRDEIKQCTDDSMKTVPSIAVINHNHQQQFDRIRWRNTALISPMNFTADDSYEQRQPTVTVEAVYPVIRWK